MNYWLGLAVRVLIVCCALFTVGLLVSIVAAKYARRHGMYGEELWVSKQTVHDIERRERRSRDARV